MVLGIKGLDSERYKTEPLEAASIGQLQDVTPSLSHVTS